MKAGRFADALVDFEQAEESPENLAAPRSSRRGPEFAYHIGSAFQALGEEAKAREQFQRGAAAKGTSTLPATQYCHALCLAGLGDQEAAEQVFDEMIETGTKRLAPVDTADYFAKFGQQETRQARIADAHFAIGLGSLGRARMDDARTHLSEAVRLNAGHTWARFHLTNLP